MKPLLKWAGGKRHIAEVISSHLPTDWDSGTYFEPFIGGAAIYLHLEPKKSVIADVNTRLINFYSWVKANPTLLVAEISAIADSFNRQQDDESKKEFYLGLRAEFNDASELGVRNAALFFSLNKLCFNGLFRENAKGGFNVPFGNKKQFPEFIEDDFIQVSEALSLTDILNTDFGEATESAQSGDFVYFDPPYVPIDLTSNFTSYTADGFGHEDQIRLANKMSSLEAHGVRAMLSNSDTPITRKIYKEFRQVQISAPRMVSAKSSGRGQISELLIFNY